MNEPITSTVGPLSGQKPYPRGPLPVPLLTVDERSEFWDQVSYEQNGCQLWTGDVLGNGAGCYYLRDAAYQAHRVAYQNRVTLGTRYGTYLGHWMYLAHICGEMRCVDPEHLRPYKRSEYISFGADYIGLNAQKDRCPEGHRYDAKDNRGTRFCTSCNLERKRNVQRVARLEAQLAAGGG